MAYSGAKSLCMDRHSLPIRARLAEYYDDAEIERWLASLHPQLEGRSALDVMKAEGSAAVHAILDRLDADAYI
jgi:uncharacterized protein (DUF2384 family)